MMIATEEDTLQGLNDRGLTILVADPPHPTVARYYLRDPEEMVYCLTEVLSLHQNIE